MKAAWENILTLTSFLPALYRDIRSFDRDFYKKFYGDLSHFPHRKLYLHFFRFGKSECRYPNADVMLSDLQREFGKLPVDFDVASYRRLNPDLNQSHYYEPQLVAHYLRHGRQEGRAYRFSPNHGRKAAGLDSRRLVEDVRAFEEHLPAWAEVFSVSQFTAWNSDWLPDKALTLQEAIALFIDVGLPQLAPINLDYVFDPAFYSSRYLVELDSDEALYRDWLDNGYAGGKAPNEVQLLRPLLAGGNFPQSFQWEKYRDERHLPASLDKFTALEKFFEAKFDIASASRFLIEPEPSLLHAIGNYKIVRGLHVEACEAFKGAIDAGSKIASTWHLLADSLVGIGRIDEALECYGKSLELPGASHWAAIHITQHLARQGKFVEACDAILKNSAAWSREFQFRTSSSQIIEAYFSHISATSKEQFRLTMSDETGMARRSGEEMLSAALERIANVTKHVFNLHTADIKRSHGHVVMLANQDLKQCTHYRVEQKAFQFADAEVRLDITPHNQPELFVQKLLGASSAIFYRVAANPGVIKAILTAQSLGVVTYYEIDDLIFSRDNYPDSFDTFEGQIEEEEYVGLLYGTVLTSFALDMCERAIASTPPLKVEMEQRVGEGNCLLLRNGLDRRNSWMIDIGNEARSSSAKVRIFYGSGTKAHNSDFNELAGPALLEVLRLNPRVELVIAGYLRLSEAFDAFEDRIVRYPFINNVDEYWSVLSTCDINIAVLSPSVFADCKSEIKWLEAAVLSIPSVVSSTATYQGIISQGVNGFLASTQSEWVAVIKQLCADADLRTTIGSAARLKALGEYSTSSFKSIVRSEFGGEVQRPHDAVEPKRKSILIANVFYAPQSIGGATRVVEDNINYFKSNASAEFDITVVCVDVGVAPEGEVRIERVDGIQVIRISTPMEVDMDLRPFNLNNEKLFRNIVYHVAPDLIHFHCIQRLTASAVKVAMDAGIPYIVTMHDAWWISDHQFLIDRDGNLELPTNDVAADAGNSDKPSTTIARRRKLEILLRNAHKRLTVSDAFALIHERAGIVDLQVTENGVTELEPQLAAERLDGRVALGHIGGRAAHKGAFLLEAVLRQHPFTNLHLTIIDGRLPFGQTVHTTWGTTPVEIKGAYPQEMVAELYADINVLVAPSIWPESFGLVSREAQSLGRWVIGSDRGAISESITDGVDGFVVDVGTMAGLREALSTIDSNPACYRRLVARPSKPLRSSDEQASQLLQIYHETLDARQRGRELSVIIS